MGKVTDLMKAKYWIKELYKKGHSSQEIRDHLHSEMLCTIEDIEEQYTKQIELLNKMIAEGVIS